ncbi:hypothetical protein A3F64_00140 [Candidatus Saccharibacteria bacterium RIFCSPHIGHO2_12_FULL_42_8]|nr:MAG: hypothetical protein A3F64_00140 [Candidatus Saccharibacteria bacterium RIFCSPHIGHO2_12_FULL_42_8]
MKEKIISTGSKLIPAVAYGDAAGLPVETLSAQKIEYDYGYIDQLVSPALNPFYEGAPIGSWSDDTQLSLAMARALIKNGGFDISTVAQEHIEELHRTPHVQVGKGDPVPRGWGHSTAESIQKLTAGISPDKSGKKDGAGNGIVMKMSPLVLWQIGQNTPDQQRWEEYDQLTTMTHDSDVARVCSRVHGDVLKYLFENGDEGLIEYVQSRALFHEKELVAAKDTSKSLAFLSKVTGFDRTTILENTDGKGFWVPQTLAMAYATYLENTPNFHKTVFEAVNLGGDTDSNASIVATMLNFSLHGVDLPQDSGRLDSLDRLYKVSSQLANTAIFL